LFWSIIYNNAKEAGFFYPRSILNANSQNEVGLQEQHNESTSSKIITLESVRIAAYLHGAFYNDTSLLVNPKINSSLRMTDWIRGFGKETFLSSQQKVCDGWTHAKSQWEKGQLEFNMDNLLVDLMDASCAQALDFDSFVDRWGYGGNYKRTRGDGSDGKIVHFSLTHGDYHPGNLLCLHDDSTSNTPNQNKERVALTQQQPQLILIDWEHVGVGSGPQDIGQYLISHLPIEEVCGMLDEITTVYRNTLTETIDAANDEMHSSKKVPPPLEDLKREIIYGGFERWVWLFGFMCGAGVPPLYMQYFHDQVHGWALMNGISVETVGMPRP